MSTESSRTRRCFFGTLAAGFPALALRDLLARDGVLGGRLHHPPKAKRVVQLFMAGAASHVDTFDDKPILKKKDGEPWDPGETVELFQSTPGCDLREPVGVSAVWPVRQNAQRHRRTARRRGRRPRVHS